ncbi:poly-beta-1,6-N-acetyl-D-glucosamine N-deacetylase PgaB [Chromobacterium violaceum]|uniref:poly-beta-1,6-N-acetyl-D-glucosamine N-deacetylase PgaB n=1 Tax=Chromobacterium violaceum TaxID=536 RepID=UPI0009DB0276|nr:poly-beta-1,6-N-acetyl-D-glucosamine N-deacetylase PgaB [Chromobacterium violaceum]OQS50515.1 poly-beta-1,6-N-acetyl-D-glucosamine N-deacetylase PgaB [Chromobacterium violaceum]OQS52699.1 poly-beta-1,6-N-acetyl-D-glucosamine N-deacetylase PgaB [Chromobacterium violaceum]QRO31547.1 poly-beta-1,6-N-acetyl-D-glucosamine N-deacetylase PgaB [Chromobacterium violaceum]QRQ18653.1 poly-beta-1,6-N-acetyl-D-glucosamine N-deacetylase PgaB [Chromobacterium violaceum]
MGRIALWLLLGCLLAPLAAASKLLVLAYHQIGDGDDYAVSAEQLDGQLGWLSRNGYRFVGVDQILAARSGGKPLPAHPVLLTFDDGRRSVYTRALPLLRRYRAPALVGLVGSWLEAPADEAIDYGGGQAPRGDFLSWDEIRALRRSGWVEVASHSYAMHHGVVANPQGNALPAYTSPAYVAAGGYESRERYLRRAADDLARNSALLRDKLGRAPRVMIWPYGSHSGELDRLAASAGMPLTLSLEDGLNPPGQPLYSLRRVLVTAGMGVDGFAAAIRRREAWPDGRQPGPRRIMHVDLDYVYDPDPATQEANLGKLLERVAQMGPDAVYLQAFADPGGDGAVRALYFPNRRLPVRADLFNRAAWQLRTRCRVKVYAWMPLLAFAGPASLPRVTALAAPGRQAAAGYPRLSPFSPEAKAFIADIYTDLARSARFDGLLFHDDATLSDYEDASPAARAAYRAAGLPDDVAALRADPALQARWTRFKTEALDAFSGQLADIVRDYQPGLYTSRNLYAPVVLQPASQAWFAQSFPEALRRYDAVAVMAMPYMEGAADPAAWMRRLFDRAAAVPGALDKTVFELQSQDWRSGKPVDSAELASSMRALRQWGARALAYYPDDFFNDRPELKRVRPDFHLPLDAH